MIKKLFVFFFVLLNNTVFSLNFKNLLSKGDFLIKYDLSDFDILGKKVEIVSNDIEGKQGRKLNNEFENLASTNGNKENIYFQIEEQSVLEKRVFIIDGGIKTNNKAGDTSEDVHTASPSNVTGGVIGKNGSETTTENNLENHGKSDDFKPLYLTMLIESRKIEEAKNEAKVEPFLENVESYSGYFTVDKTYNSNLFFWYFPAEVERKTAPVVLWLNGGPGFTSMYGLFYEIGPYQIVNRRIEKREVYWSKNMHLIFIDNPVGTGFSFTENEFGFAKNESQIGEHLYEALFQFFTLFNELKNNRFYIAGESYAGKYVPAISYTIHKNNKVSKFKINLSGLAIGNGLSDPINQLDYGSYLFNIGLIDENQKSKFENLQTQIKKSISQNKTDLGYDLFYKLIFGDLTLFKNSTGFHNFFSFLNPDNKDDEDFANLENVLNSKRIQKSIHVNKVDFRYRNLTVRQYLKTDFLQSVTPWLSILMNNYKVMIYNGQLDIIIPYLFTNNYLRYLPWCGQQNFLAVPREQWYSDGKLAGYVKKAVASENCSCDGAACNGSVNLVLVRNAGHTVPQDQPHWMYELISNFTSN